MENIIKKLHIFIRRYHLVLLLNNIMFFFIMFLLVSSFFAIIEYTLWLDTTYRKVLFLIGIFIIFVYGVIQFVLPFVKVSRYYKKIDEKKAADIIGSYFPEIGDKFRNLLELNDLRKFSRENLQLLEAAIEQKSKLLEPYKLTLAIDYKKLKKVGILFSVLILFFLFASIKSPEVLIKPINRIVHYNQEFVKPAPFDFILKNEKLEGISGEEFLFELKLNGEKFPASVYIEINGNEYQMQKISNSEFIYKINQLHSDFNFRFKGNDYYSKLYNFKVYQKPSITYFECNVIYPSYLEKENEIFKNTTDFLIPQGTKIISNIYAKNTTKIKVIENEKELILNPIEGKNNSFLFSSIYKTNSKIKIVPLNNSNVEKDTLFINVNIIQDIYPSISVIEFKDSIFINNSFFKGKITDDYGFNNLKFYYKDKNSENYEFVEIPIIKNLIEQEFYFSFDFSKIENYRTKNFEYYFEVADNDAINGYKKTKTQLMNFKTIDEKELEKNYTQKMKEIETSIDNTLKSINELKNEANQLKMDLLNKKNIGWEEKKRLEDILKKQEKLEEEILNISEKNKIKNKFEELSKDLPQDLLEKQKKLEEMFEKVFDKETKELLKQLQELINEMNKEKIMEHLEKIKLRNEDIERELDRNMALLKQLEFEKNMNNLIDKLRQTREKQDSLSKSNVDKKEMEEQQKQINDEFKEVKEQIKKLEEDNKSLYEPMDFPKTDDLVKDIENELNKALDNISKNNKSDAKKNQQNSSKKMQELEDKLQNAFDKYSEETLEEDIENLQRILKSLLNLSFMQESIMQNALKITRRDPFYGDILNNQKRLIVRYKVVEDSLNALAKRQIAIQSVIKKDINEIKRASKEVEANLERGNVGFARTQQQYLMQSLNNLALLLLESLDQMNEQKNEMKNKKGGGMCRNKSGSGQQGKPDKPSAKTIKQLQEKLNKQMQEMLEKMKRGEKMGGQTMSEQFAKMAAMQEAIREKLKEYRDMLMKEGQGDAAKLLNEIMQEMEKTEKELIYKKLNEQTIKRQNEIMVRLLESEKAELKREKEERRESETAKFYDISNPGEFFKYNINKKTSDETLKTIQPIYNLFYRQKINNFLLNLTD